MSINVLPKARGGSGINIETRKNSSRVSSLQDLSHKGRIISGRQSNKNKRIISNNRGDLFVGRQEDPNASFGEENAIDFNENKNTILSNFEEWIKLSTDNKITSKNSWQFALIDYFHDLNVIKDGEDINFQRASATLDGCVKIYSSRVESVATETGKLLSGLATKKVSSQGNNDEADSSAVEGDGADGDEIVNEESRKKRKMNRVVESTLVPFQNIQVRKLDQELTIDPLFKKALAEFDEGGSKSLLINTLNIDVNGRVVFDATSTFSKDEQDPKKVSKMEESPSKGIIDGIFRLKDLFINDLDAMEQMHICPSIEQLNMALSNLSGAKEVLGPMNQKFINDENEELSSNVQPKLENVDFDLGGLEFNELADEYDNKDDEFNDVNISTKKVLEPYNLHRVDENLMDQDLMAYFDEELKSNWRGPEHWRVSTFKSTRKIESDLSKKAVSSEATKEIKKKESKIINFFDDGSDESEEELFEMPKNISSTLNKADKRESEDLNKLPEDIRYNSQRLINLFCKPLVPIRCFVKSAGDGMTDAFYFAEQYDQQEKLDQAKISTSMRQADMEEVSEMGFENDFGGIDFNDALEGGDILNDSGIFSSEREINKNENEEGRTLISKERKARPEYVNFSRIAKRVDVRLLKNNIWREVEHQHQDENRKNDTTSKADLNKSSESLSQEGDRCKDSQANVKFGTMIRSVASNYAPDERKDLSTSFYFICLLHLANEHGFQILDNEAHDDLEVVWN